MEIEDKYFIKDKNLSTYLRTKLLNLLKTNKIFGKYSKLSFKVIIKRNYKKKCNNFRRWTARSSISSARFNLILRDIKKLNELISKNLRLGLTIKDSNIPKDLSDSRKPENLLMGLGIDTTRKFFKAINI